MKRTVIGGTILALAISGIGVSQAAPPSDKGPKDGGGKPAASGFKVTGGGQIIAEGQQGPGDTVGFNAHDLDDEGPAARGQFQYIPRGESTNASAPKEKFHGVVTCLLSGGEALAWDEAPMDDNDEIMPGMARFGGQFRDDPTKFFTVDVTDMGQGESSEDAILVRITDEPCADNPESDDDEEGEELMMLGRGNVKIHNNPDSADAMMASALR